MPRGHVRCELLAMTLPVLVLLVLALVVAGLLPVWPHSRAWGYAPSSLAGVVLLFAAGLFLVWR
jgi:hypothetical protein